MFVAENVEEFLDDVMRRFEGQPFPPMVMEDSLLIRTPRGRPYRLPLTRPAYPEDTVWHYSRKSPIDSIRETGVLRATRYEDLADPQEIAYGLALLSTAYQDATTGMYPLAVRHWVKWIISHAMPGIFEWPFYVFCVSHSSDIAYLWENYAVGGGSLGMAAGHRDRLAVLDRKRRCVSSDYNFTPWLEVEYDPDRQRALALGLVEYLFAIYPDEWLASQGLIYSVPFWKSAAYAQEEEFRVVIAGRTEGAEQSTTLGRRYVELTFAGNNTYSPQRRIAEKVVYSPAELPEHEVKWADDRV